MINSRYIYGLFSKAGIKEKELQQSLVLQFTNGRTERTSLMLQDEAKELTNALQRMVDDPGDKMRKKIIHYAHLVGWKDASGKADINALNAWCIRYGMYKKPLNDHNIEELSNLVSQFERVFKSYLNNM